MGGSPSQPASTVPDRIGRYEVLLPIASGGMGTVHLARTHGAGGFQRDVAIKVLHPHLRDQHDFCADLIEEAKIAGRIRHPHVVPVLDVGTTPEGVFLVMDYVEGDSLAGLQGAAQAEGAAVPLPIGLRVLVDGLLGLHAAHELRDEAGQSFDLIHRDVSPQNILVGVDGMSRLTDFGIARASARLEHSLEGVLKGKLRYMSPEQVRGEAIDRRTDVWAAGIVAWELLAGRRLFADKHQAGAVLQVVSDPPPRLRQVRREIPVGLDEAVASALQISLPKRCGTAKQLAERLTESAREVGWLAARDAVADYVQSLVGASLTTRRQQISEVLKLRQEITAITRSVAIHTEGSNSSDVVLRRDAAPEDASTVRMRHDAPSQEDQDEGETETTRRAAPTTSTAGGRAREERTDRRMGAERRRARVSWIAKLLPGLAVAVALLGIVALVRLVSSSPDPELALSTSPADRPPAPTPPSDPSTPSATASHAQATNPTLTVQADSPVALLRLGEREFVIESPTRELAVPLTAEEHRTAMRVSATSADGREASADHAPGDTHIELLFPPLHHPAAVPPRPGRSQPEPQPPPKTAAPLATNPYLKK